jgi:hypothetical protein
VTVAQALLVALVHGVVVGAVEVAAQQVVARVALVLHHADHPAHGHAHQRQRVAGQHQRAFDGLGHHLGGAGGAQLVQVGVVLVRTTTGTCGAWAHVLASTLSADGVSW